MAISDLTASVLGGLIKEYVPETFSTAANIESPLLGTDALKKIEDIEGEFVATLYPAGSDATGFVPDKGRLPNGSSGKPIKAKALPAAMVSVISQGRHAALLNPSTKTLVDNLHAEMETRASEFGRVLGRALHKGSGVVGNADATWTGTAADSTVDIDFTDISMFAIGDAVDFLDDSASKAYVVRVLDITPAVVGSNSANVAGTVTFINDVINPATGAVVALTNTAFTAADDSFALRGYTAGFGAANTSQSALPSSFDDIAGDGAAASFMGVDPTTTANKVYNWKGQTKALAAAYSQEALLAHMGLMRQRGGGNPDTVVVHPQVAAAHMSSGDYKGGLFGQTSGMTAGHPASGSLDKYGDQEKAKLTAGGRTMVQDPNCPCSTILAFDSKQTKLAIWQKMGPAMQSGDPVLLGQTYFDQSVQLQAGINLVSTKRASAGTLTGVTNL